MNRVRWWGGVLASVLSCATASAAPEAVVLHRQKASVNAVAFAPDGRRFAAAGFRSVHIWDESGQGETLPLPLDEGPVLSLAWSPEGDRLAVGAIAGPIFLCDARRPRVINALRGHKGSVYNLVFTPDGKELVSAGGDGTLRVWCPATGQELRQLDHRHPIVRAALPKLAAVIALALSADGTLLASGDALGDIQLWDLPTGRLLRSMKADGDVWGLAFAPTTPTLVSAGASLCIWEVATGQPIRRLPGHEGTTYAVAFDASGCVLASGGKDRAVRLWDLLTGQELAAFAHHSDTVYGIALAPGRPALLSSSEDGTVQAVDLVSPASARLALPRAAKREQLECWWASLADADGASAFEAIRGLTGSNGQGVRFLGERLKPVALLDPEAIPRLIADLDSDRFRIRESAADELERLEDVVVPALEAKQAANPSPELRRRIGRLLQGQRSLLQQPAKLQAIRAIGILEQAHTPEAEVLLERLAAGQPEARQTREARLALDRLRRQSHVVLPATGAAGQ